MQVLKINIARQEIAADDVQTDAAERVWADRIRAGDIHAFEALYRTYWQRLYAFAFRYVRSQDDAEDVTQEVFFKIWRGREHWVPAGPVRNYLYLSVRNAARDRLQRAVVARRWRVRQVQVGPVAAIPSQLDEAELAAALEQALHELPCKRSAVCKLRLIDGLTYAEIAERLGIAEGSIGPIRGRCLERLRHQIEVLRQQPITSAAKR
jgi:RNA polymerase sigma-70 factor (ECF subfamily)